MKLGMAGRLLGCRNLVQQSIGAGAVGCFWPTEGNSFKNCQPNPAARCTKLNGNGDIARLNDLDRELRCLNLGTFAQIQSALIVVLAIISGAWCIELALGIPGCSNGVRAEASSALQVALLYPVQPVPVYFVPRCH
jgi:hypothetical protein